MVKAENSIPNDGVCIFEAAWHEVKGKEWDTNKYYGTNIRVIYKKTAFDEGISGLGQKIEDDTDIMIKQETYIDHMLWNKC